MTRFDSGATDGFVPAGATHAENPVSSYRRFIGPAAAVVVAAGLALPLAYYASFPARESPSPVVVSSSLATPEKVSALVAASDVDAAEPERAKPRAARVDTASPPTGAVEELQPKVPPRDDPRWARAAATNGPALPEPVETAELRSKLEKLQEAPPAAATPASGNQQEAPVRSAAAEVPEETSETDATFTGTIPAGEAAATSVGIAGETVPPAEEFAAAPDAAAEEPVAEAQGPATRFAKITTYVNMRAGPENEAEVLTVLPTGASVNVMGDCEHWCEVDFKGRRGYVYKSFVSGT